MASNDKPNTMSKFEANSRKCRAEVDHHTKHAWVVVLVVVLEIEVDIQEEQDKHKEKAKQEPKFSLNCHAPPFVPRCAKQHAFEEARPKLPATTASINPFAPPFVPRCGPRRYNFGRQERKEQALYAPQLVMSRMDGGVDVVVLHGSKKRQNMYGSCVSFS